MLSAGAYSFRQKAKLAVSLSWIGGYTNVISLLAMGTLVSHVTGSVTLLGRSIGTGDYNEVFFLLFIVFAFTAGAITSALLTETAKRRGWRSKYILPMGLEAVLLAMLVARLETGSAHSGPLLYEAAGLASLAMGLQNATITKISGSVVRTTHLTGIFTDLGLESVQYFFWWCDELAKKKSNRAGRLLLISRRHPSALRLVLLLSIALSFGGGALAGTVAYMHWHGLSLLASVAFLVLILFEDWRSPIADIRELDLVNDPELKMQGLINQLLPDEVAMYRSSSGGGRAKHRAPNFQLWIDRIPRTSRVVVLAISPLTRFDTNAVMDLEIALNRLHAQQRKLILSGVTTHQFKALDALGIGRVMDVNNICPDLEFAIARALAVLHENGRK